MSTNKGGQFQLHWLATLFVLLLLGASCSSAESSANVRSVAEAAVAARQLNDHAEVPVLAPPLPELDGHSPPLLEPLTEAVAVMAAADRLGSRQAGSLVGVLVEEAATLDEGPSVADPRGIPSLVRLVRSMEMSGQDASQVRRLLFPAIEERATFVGDDIFELLLFGDELEGLQHLAAPTQAESEVLSETTLTALCDANTHRAMEQMHDVESFRNVDQVSMWLGMDCRLRLSQRQHEQAAGIVKAVFEERLEVAQAPLFNLNHAGWFLEAGLLPPEATARALALSNRRITVPSDDYGIGDVGYALLFRGSEVDVSLSEPGLDIAVLHARGRGFLAPSEFPGELVLLADLNRILGRDLHIEPRRIEEESLDLRWALAAIPESGVAPLQESELDMLDGAQNLGFTASLAAARYLTLSTVPEDKRCAHATAVDLSESRQILWAALRVGEICDVEIAPWLSDPNDQTSLTFALIELDECLGTEIPIETEFPEVSVDEAAAATMYVDELWAIVVRTLVREGQCSLVVG